MSRSLKAILMLAMLLAVILAGILFSDLLRGIVDDSDNFNM